MYYSQYSLRKPCYSKGLSVNQSVQIKKKSLYMYLKYAKLADEKLIQVEDVAN